MWINVNNTNSPNVFYIVYTRIRIFLKQFLSSIEIASLTFAREGKYFNRFDKNINLYLDIFLVFQTMRGKRRKEVLFGKENSRETNTFAL